MLCLSRKIQERIIITVPPSDRERRIVIAVAHIDREKVRLAFGADRDIAVDREEVAERIAGERTNA